MFVNFQKLTLGKRKLWQNSGQNYRISMRKTPLCFQRVPLVIPNFQKNFKMIFEGHVAQWTRACGYEPQSRGFESLLAHKIKTSTLSNIPSSVFLNKKVILFQKAFTCICISKLIFFKKNEQLLFIFTKVFL